MYEVANDGLNGHDVRQHWRPNSQQDEASKPRFLMRGENNRLKSISRQENQWD
jgi:hypothetical protein